MKKIMGKMERSINKDMANESDVKKKELTNEFTNVVDDTIPLEKLFDPTRGMAKVYSNNKGGEVYACVYRDKVDKVSQLALRIKYPDGDFSETIIVKQSELFEIPIPRIIRDPVSLDKKVQYKGEELESREALRLLKRAKILKRLSDYTTKAMKINYVRLFYILQKHYNKLPIKEFENKYPIYDVYQLIVEKAYEKTNKDPSDKITIKDDSYTLTYDELIQVAEESGYSINDLCKELMFYDLLVVDKDRKRFQHSITYRGETKRYYSIKNERTLRIESSKKPKVEEIPYEKSPKCMSVLFLDIPD